MKIRGLIAFTLRCWRLRKNRTLQLLLTLSHSQAAVERGFSVNKEVLAPNMQESDLFTAPC